MIPKTTAKNLRAFWGACLLITVLFPSAARVETVESATGQVQIHNLTFTPGVLTVKAGTEVTFTNRDGILHSVIARDGRFDSGALDTDESFAFTFATPGEYSYFCGLHSHMTAKIVVVP